VIRCPQSFPTLSNGIFILRIASFKILNIINVKSDLKLLPSVFLTQEDKSVENNLLIQIQDNLFFENMLKNTVEILPGIFFNQIYDAIISSTKIFNVKCYVAIIDFIKKPCKR